MSTYRQTVALVASLLALVAALAVTLGLVLFAFSWAIGRLSMTPLLVASVAALSGHFLFRWASLAQNGVAESIEQAAEQRGSVRGRKRLIPAPIASAILVSVLMSLQGFLIIMQHGFHKGGQFHPIENWRWAGGAWLAGAVVVLAEACLQKRRTRLAEHQ